MPRTNLSLGNLHRAVSGSVRTTQQVSIGQLGGAASNSSFTSFAIDSVTFNVPTFTYIVESTTENASFSFGTSGSLFSTKVSRQANNYTCSFNNSNFTVGTPVYANTTFPINAASVAVSQYSEASSSLTLGYADGYNINATNHGGKTSKTLYAVDVYNTINQPDFCLLFGTQITLANGSSINVEDLVVGDIIKSWVPAGLPDESQDPDSDQLDWRFYMLEEQSGSAQDVVVNDITFNFAAGYYDLNNGLIKATGTHPLWVNDVEINKYHFKAIQDVVIGDKVVTYDETNGLTEIEVTDIGVITEDIEIVTLNVENADVYLANGTISHNKGTSTQPYIPSAGLRMYLDPSKAASTNGTATTDWLDLSGYNTGVRPAGVANAAGVSGKLNPAYNNGASRKEKYWQGASNAFWYKDGTTNINGGYTQFNTSAFSVIAWVRFATHPANGYYNFFNKQDVSGTRIISMYVNSNGSGNYFIHEGSTVQYVGNTTALSTNTWYMVSYTAALSGTNVGYFDKTSTGTISNGAKDYTTSAMIQIGGNYAENTYYFPGQIGPVLFYNRQLNSTEIGQVYDYFSPSYK
jgi:hypothetical protein